MSDRDAAARQPAGAGNGGVGGDASALAALALAAQHHGVEISVEGLRRSHPFQGTEPSLPRMIEMAQANGLVARIVTIEAGELGTLVNSVPAVLRLADGQFVLLVRVDKRDGIDLALLRNPHDAEDAVVAVDEARLREAWQGEALLLKRRWRLTDGEQPFGIRWLVGQILLEKKLFRDIAFASTISSVFLLGPPLIFMLVLDRVLVHHSFSTLYVLLGAIFLLIAFDTLYGYLRRALINAATLRIDGRINLYVYDKLLKLPISFFERQPTGIINGKVGEIWRIRSFLTGQLFTTILDGITALILVPVLFALSWRLALLVMALTILSGGVYALFLPAMRRRHNVVVQAMQQVGAHQVETIYGIRTIKSLALDGLKRRERDIRIARMVEARAALGSLANWPQTIAHPIERLIYSGSMALGAYMLLMNDNMMYPGELIAFSMIAQRAAMPLIALSGLLETFEEVRGAVTEVASVMNVPPEDTRSGMGLKEPIHGAIDFQDVGFRYPGAATLALQEVAFAIPRGTIYGVMGRSGSGKTTVTRLLQGLHRDYEGLIKIDGMDLREIDLDHLRTNVGVVLQENFLFSGTIRENISAPRPNASFDRIVRAAQLAGAEEFIERLPRGYETMIEEGAVNFSGGQRQRLAIARALLTEPPILVLDEATSALDAESEAIVNANLMRIARNRTVIIISHRLSSLIPADAILVLERGKVYDIGRHDELLGRCDIYKNLWHQQNRHLDSGAPHVRFAVPAAPVL